MTESLRDSLRRQRDAILKELRAMSPRAAELVEELDIVLDALARMQKAPGTNKYVGYKDVIGPIRLFLEEHGKPASRDEIVSAVLDGGWMGGDAKRGFRVRHSLQYFTQPNNMDRLAKIKKIKDRYGLYEWPDAKWRT